MVSVVHSGVRISGLYTSSFPLGINNSIELHSSLIQCKGCSHWTLGSKPSGAVSGKKSSLGIGYNWEHSGCAA